jgi:GT2 family glycosyltransferase
VIVPTYKRRLLLLDALEAISHLEGESFEVVIVDDGTPDGPIEAVVRRARDLGLAGRVVRLGRNRGRSTARNVGILHARADLIAFTDDDCTPDAGWLAAGSSAMCDSSVGIVQGRTEPSPAQRQPLFSHFIETRGLDGSFSTSNVIYRRTALVDAGGFDPQVTYWEDADLGWRVCRAGWRAVFEPTAVVYHRVIPLSLRAWLGWPLHFRYMPAKVARYPELRRFLFLRLWVHWSHALFDLALAAAVLGSLVHRRYYALALPYVVAFPAHHGLRGRWPPVKAVLHLTWDAVSCVTLVVSSLRHRSPVL